MSQTFGPYVFDMHAQVEEAWLDQCMEQVSQADFRLVSREGDTYKIIMDYVIHSHTLCATLASILDKKDEVISRVASILALSNVIFVAYPRGVVHLDEASVSKLESRRRSIQVPDFLLHSLAWGASAGAWGMFDGIVQYIGNDLYFVKDTHPPEFWLGLRKLIEPSPPPEVAPTLPLFPRTEEELEMWPEFYGDRDSQAVFSMREAGLDAVGAIGAGDAERTASSIHRHFEMYRKFCPVVRYLHEVFDWHGSILFYLARRRGLMTTFPRETVPWLVRVPEPNRLMLS